MKTIRAVLWCCLWCCLFYSVGCGGELQQPTDDPSFVEFETGEEPGSPNFDELVELRDGVELHLVAGTSVDREQLAARDGYATSIFEPSGKSWELKVASGVSDQDFASAGFTKSDGDGLSFYHKTTEPFADFEPDCAVYIEAGNGLYATLRRSVYEGDCPTSEELMSWLPDVAASRDVGNRFATKEAALVFGAYTGSFNGVNSYSNENVEYYCPDFKPLSKCNSWVGTELAGIKWQCVEYADRYYLSVYGHTKLWKGHAKYWYGQAPYQGLQRFPNCGATPPMEGDMIVSNDGPYGHIAIVRSVGPNWVGVIQQNWHQNQKDNFHIMLYNSLQPGKHCVWPFGNGYKVKGWIRK